MNIKQDLLTAGFTKGRNGYDGKKSFKIEEITVHHAAGVITLPTLKNVLVSKNISASYGLRDTDVVQYVLEENTPWTNSQEAANSRAVTIEVCNSEGAPDWPVSLTSYETLIELVYDIAKRNNLLPLVKGVSLTWHRMYSNTACPGNWLFARLDNLVTQVNALYYAETGVGEVPGGNIAPMYRVRASWDDAKSQVGAFKNLDNATALCDQLNAAPRYTVYDGEGNVVYPK